MRRKAIFLSTPKLWQRGHGPSHPLKPERLQRTHELLQAYGAFQAENAGLVTPRYASGEELALFHTADYIEAVRKLSSGDRSIPAWRYGFGPGDNPVFEGMFGTERLKVGSALMAAEWLLEETCAAAFSFSGGLHHAGADHASGFCVFNDTAVVIQWLISRDQRVAYVDIDVHHGDGVQWAFYDTDQVLTVSLHQDGRTLFPGTGSVDEIGRGEGEGYSVNIPLPPATMDEAYLWAFDEVVPPLIERFQADVLVTQLGVDTHYQDPLAQLCLTTKGHEALFARMSQFCERWLALGGGGYALDVVPRSWALAFGVMSGQDFPDLLPTSYRSAYGGDCLRDHVAPRGNAAIEEHVCRTVEQVVQAVKRIHKI
jgi:acetoin utilization protein AcuC